MLAKADPPNLRQPLFRPPFPAADDDRRRAYGGEAALTHVADLAPCWFVAVSRIGHHHEVRHQHTHQARASAYRYPFADLQSQVGVFPQGTRAPLLDTIKMSVLGSVIGSVLALPFSITPHRPTSSKTASSWPILRVILNIVRTLPTLVIASISALMFGLGYVCRHRGDLHLHLRHRIQNDV